MDYWGFLEKGYGLLATKFKDYGLFVLHFKITDYYRSLSHRLLLHKRVLKGHKSYKKNDTCLSPVGSLGDLTIFAQNHRKRV